MHNFDAPFKANGLNKCEFFMQIRETVFGFYLI